MKFSTLCFGAFITTSQAVMAAATPTACIESQFNTSGDAYWKSVTLKLTNHCDKAIDFQDATITFKSTTALDTTFWGDFSPLSYPDNALNISSQSQSDGSFLSTLSLHFPSYSGSSSILPVGSSFQITYGSNSADQLSGTTNVYLQTPVVGATGTLQLINKTSKPDTIHQAYVTVHMSFNGQVLDDIQLPWASTKILNHLAAGSYGITPETIADASGKSYQGIASANTVNVEKNKTASSNITYTAVTQQTGNIVIKSQALPAGLSGYTATPSVLISQVPNGNAVSKTIAWNASTPISQLVSDSTYGFSTADINFNGSHCIAKFNPQTVVANPQNSAITQLSYQCAQVAQNSVTFNIKGAPTTVTSLNITLKPNNNTAPIVQSIDVSNGNGTGTLMLSEGSIYTVQIDPVTGYSPSFSLQPLTASADANETITFSKASTTSGRIIGYLPGWKTPPSAQSLADAGYTHIMVAFGVFSTTTPGAIVSAFDTVTAEYIQQLHQANIKVILSLGGASTSIPNTTVSFHQILSAAPSAEVFKQTFISSLQQLFSEYGFDGFDIDIEQDFIPSGTFTQPQGDIAVLANIINTMYSQNPALLITLAPQVANVSATAGFDKTWGNYASLIMQTYHSLAWVGIQLYNTGCAYGIDQVCYSQTETNTPNFSVAMATDLLADWPATLEDGRATGFQPYISYLNPSQVVLGYPAPNASGDSDGRDAVPTSTIIRAIECLKTAAADATSCGTYLPPKAFGNIGGVFNWEVTYDQNNGFKFAKELKPCVINGICK
ncbi:MAG: hypothetical protein CK424_08610 [Legionella sp.]|nr:MAG: hypothetical protein CK424_08610 [Legionella sp.]